jgi:hypothetical protein
MGEKAAIEGWSVAIGLALLPFALWPFWLPWAARLLRRHAPKSEASLGTVNAVIGTVIAAVAVPQPYNWILAFVIAALGFIQYSQAEKSAKRRIMALRSGFKRKGHQIYNDLQDLITPLRLQRLRYFQARNLTTVENPEDARRRFEGMEIDIINEQNEVGSRFRREFANEIYFLVEDMREQLDLDSKPVLDILKQGWVQADEVPQLAMNLEAMLNQMNDDR